MLLRSGIGKRMEKMCIMCGPHLHCPGFHAGGNLVGYASVQLRPVFDGGKHGLVGLSGHVASHLEEVKHILAEILRHRSIFNAEAFGVVGCRFIQCSLSERCHKLSRINSQERPQR